MNTIRQLCTRCIVLEHGKLIFDGDVEKAIGIYMDLSRDESVEADYVQMCIRDRSNFLIEGQPARLCDFAGFYRKETQ